MEKSITVYCVRIEVAGTFLVACRSMLAFLMREVRVLGVICCCCETGNCCVTVDRFFHQNLTGQQAEERMQSVTSKPGTFLVRPSQSQHDCFVLSVVVGRHGVNVLHVKITFQVGNRPRFFTYFLLFRQRMVVWLTGKSGVAHINKVTLRRAGLVLRWVTVCGIASNYPGRLSLASSPWVGVLSTGDCYR